MSRQAVLSGVYKLHNLTDAQACGLTLIWGHNLDALVDWMLSTRSPLLPFTARR